MPSPDDFLSSLAELNLVPETTIVLLEKKLEKNPGRVSVNSLVKFLVETGAITKEQADDVVGGLYDTVTEEPELELGLDLSGIDEEKPPRDPAEGADMLVEAPSATFDEPSFESTEEESLLGEIESPDATAEGLTEEAVVEANPKRRSTRHKHLKKAKGNEFDSPLILLGFGGLVVLILAGAGIYFLLNSESGDERLHSAQSAYEAGSFSQAITEFDEFVIDFPTHAGFSKAKVQLVIARLRQAVDTGRNYAKGLTIAKQQLPRIEDEVQFSAAHGDLASLLPKIAQEIALKAEVSSEAGEAEAAAAGVILANEALDLVGNAKYVPRSLRDDIQIGAIRETLARIERRRLALVELKKVIDSMNESVASSSPGDAYTAYTSLLDSHPELASEQSLVEALKQVADAEQNTIRFVEEAKSATKTERPTTVFRAIGVANQELSGVADAEGIYLSTHAGIVYAMQARDGSLLWRRSIGIGNRAISPIAVDEDYLLVDHRAGDLLRVNGTTGKLVWRVAIGPGILEPVLAEQRIFVATEPGRLFVFEAATGAQAGYVAMAQPLRAAPAYDRMLKRIYLTGEHSSLYTLDSIELNCLEVYHLGHRAGSVLLPPMIIGDKLAVVENVGFETANLRLLGIDGDGIVKQELTSKRLEGTCDNSPLLAGRRLAISTRLGEVRLYEVSAAGSDREPLRELAARLVGRQKPGTRHLAFSQGAVWVAGNQLTKNVASLSESRLVIQRLEKTFSNDQFVAPLQVSNSTLLHARQQEGQTYISIAATNNETGATIWQTNVALSPVIRPTVSNKLRGLLVADQLGGVFLIGRDAIREGVVNKTLIPNRNKTVLDNGVLFADGRQVLTAIGSDKALPVVPGASRPARSYRLPGKLACAPVAMGEGWLAPLEIGQVHLLDPQGKPLAAPFQPRLAPGQQVEWLRPGVSETNGKALALIANRSGSLFCLELKGSNPASLSLVSSQLFEERKPNSGVVIVGNRAAVGVSGGLVALVTLPGMESVDTVKINGSIAWGPYAVGEKIVLANDNQELLAIDPETNKVAWKLPLEKGLPVGKPLVEATGCLLSMEQGSLLSLNPNTGDVTNSVVVGQRLAKGPTPYGKRLLLVTQDSALLVVEHP